MSLAKPVAARRLVPALFPLAHADVASAAASRRARRRGAFVATPPTPPPSPSSVRLAEPLPSLAPSRLALHNRILALLTPSPDSPARPDLDEAALLTRHALHSNCRPTSFTCTAVMAALLRARRLDEFFALHRFALQAAVPPTAATHALYLSALVARGLPDAALHHIRLIARPGAAVPPSPTAYRVVVKSLVDHGRLADAVELKNEMLASGFVGPDPKVYSLLMAGFVKARDGAKALGLYQELQDNVGSEPVLDGILYGSLMKTYFLVGMEEEAMECYKEALCSESLVRFGAESYNEVVDALGQNGRLEDALKLFDRMLKEHDPPLRIAVDLRSFNVMVNAYCAAWRPEDAIAVFRRMGEWKVAPDVAAYNNLIQQLGLIQLIGEMDVLYKEMAGHGLSADEETYVLLMEAYFMAGCIDNGISYFDKMVELELKPDASAYHRLIDGLVRFSWLDKAQEYLDQMREKKIIPSIGSYEILLKANVQAMRLDDAAKIAKCILLDEKVFSDEMRELLEDALRANGREDDITKLYEDVKREKAEAAARAAEEKAKAEALVREERERRRAEMAAKDEAAAKASADAIAAILGHKRKTEDESEAPVPTLAANTRDDDLFIKLGIRSAGEGDLQGTPLSAETEQANGQK